MKKILNVINVGQGDSSILQSLETHKGSMYDLVIDVGTNKRDITQLIGEKAKIMITHGHSDHLSGFQYFTGCDFEKVDELILPLHFNEILVMAKMITKIKGIKASTYGRTVCESLNNILMRCYILGKSVKAVKIAYVHEGMSLYDHLKILNPQKPAFTEIDLYAEMKSDNFRLLRAIFSEDAFREVSVLLEAIYNENICNSEYCYDFPTELGEFNLYGIKESLFNPIYSGKHRLNLILDYFMRYEDDLMSFCDKPTNRSLKSLYRQYTEICNDSSIVFIYNIDDSKTDERTRFLFAGDAGKKVLKRIISNGHNLSCDYFKVPHHGGKDCLNKTLLKKIRPQHAIISHDNGNAGRNNAPHPVQRTIELLKEMECEVYCTNNVIKNDIIIHEKAIGLTEDQMVEFI